MIFLLKKDQKAVNYIQEVLIKKEKKLKDETLRYLLQSLFSKDV